MAILLVEDNPGDVRVVAEVLAIAELEHHLHVVTDGDAAIEFLRRTGAHAGAPRPDLVLLDLTLPRRNGREVLSEVKHDDDLARIPVVVLSTSDAEADIANAYALDADLYLTKPATFDEFSTLAGRLVAFCRDHTR